MHVYKIYKGANLPNTFLVLPKQDNPETTVPFNLLYLFGDLSLTKGAVKASYLPFSKGSQAKLVEAVETFGYCFYKWPGKVLGSSLGDLLESEGMVIALDGPDAALPAVVHDPMLPDATPHDTTSPPPGVGSRPPAESEEKDC